MFRTWSAIASWKIESGTNNFTHKKSTHKYHASERKICARERIQSDEPHNYAHHSDGDDDDEGVRPIRELPRKCCILQCFW